MTGSAPRAEAISPTAHYTAAVWARHGLSHPALVTPTGRLMLHSLRPTMALNRALGGATLEGYLLARHRAIDHLLDDAIRREAVSQVIEIACGLSPRGWRFATRYGDRLTYVEADLPHMAARKREALARTGSLGDHHRVAEIDALSEDGPQSVAALAGTLDPQAGTAIITEGLLTYLDHQGVTGVWRRTAQALAGFPHGLYLSDLHLENETAGLAAAVFLRALSTFVGGRVELHFRDVAEATSALEAAGLAHVTLHRPDDFAELPGIDPRDARMVRVIEART